MVLFTQHPIGPAGVTLIVTCFIIMIVLILSKILPMTLIKSNTIEIIISHIIPIIGILIGSIFVTIAALNSNKEND